MKVVIYVRVSTQEQAKEGYSIGEQVERLKKYCEAMGWIVVEVYIDPGYSGGSLDRPGLKKLIRDVKDGGIERVVVYKLDRLSRSQKDTLFLIEDVFLKHNTDFVSMNENFDTSTPFGRAMIGILAVFAQLEREQIKERMGMGKEARAKEGKWHGGPFEPIGYDYNKATEVLEDNEYEQMQLRELRSLFMQHVPLRTIETMFLEKGYTIRKGGKWTPTIMRRALRSKVYLGYIRRHDEWHKGSHNPVFTQEEYDEQVKLLDARAEQYAMTGVKPGVVTTYLGSLLYCKRCGAKYAKNSWPQRDGSRVMLYGCYSRMKKSKPMIKDPNCKNKYWRVDELDKVVFDEIKKLATDPDYFTQKRKSRPKTDKTDKVGVIEKEIEKIDAQISRFMDLYGLGKFSINQLSSKVDPLNEARSGLQRELDTLNSEAGRLSEGEAVELLESFEEVLEHGDFNEIRGLIDALIYYIELDGDDVTIHWKFA